MAGAGQGPTDTSSETLLHATAVAVNGQGVLIRGPSGAGKSGLALQLMSLGARLVADDGVVVRRTDSGQLLASAPPATSGLIEARWVGLLRADASQAAPLALIVDLATPETQRLPPRRVDSILGVHLPLFHRVDAPHFPAAILQYILGGRSD